MAGPNITMPSPDSVIVRVDEDDEGKITNIYMSQDWASFLSMVAQTTYLGSRSGTTAERPNTGTIGRYVGMCYFDTTLGLPVFLKTASSSAWVKADGTAA